MKMKIKGNAAIVSAMVSDALAWVAFLWLLLWPYSYQGTSITQTAGEPPGQITETHASLLAVNGFWVIIPLLIPVVITALLLVVTLSSNRRAAKLTAWPMAAILLVFCVMSGFSIGMFYLPAALVSIVTAFLLLRRKMEVKPPSNT